jgi:hypothetical protein
MSGSQTNRTWQADLVARYPGLFDQQINGRVTAPGYPTTGDGWRDLVETAIGLIASAVAATPGGTLQIGQIKEKFATLRVYPDSRSGLPESISAAVDEAIELAEARSACTCGTPGRLFKSGGWFLTACDKHCKGKPVRERPGFENLHITRQLVDGKRAIRATVIRETDTFEQVDPSTLKLDEE